MKTVSIPLVKIVIFFVSGFELTERFLLKNETIIFPANSFWKVLLDSGNPEMKIILQNCQDKTRKTLSYVVFGKIFATKTDQIILMREEDVPIIIKL